jgi:hypothetical protein
MKLSSSAQVVAPLERDTFHYVTAPLTPVATATDVLTLSGSASRRVVRVLGVKVTGLATAASAYRVNFIKRLAANTDGTSTNPTPGKANSASSDATATLTLYTANPSALGSGSTLASDLLWLPAAATPTAPPGFVMFDDPIVLRGTSELLAVNFGGAAVPSGTSISIEIMWSEDGE